MIFKITHLKQTHLLSKKLNFTALIEYIKSSFKNIPTKFNLHYVDSDGDNIQLNSQNDLDILYQVPQQKTIKIFIEKIEQSNENDFPIIEQEFQQIKQKNIEQKSTDIYVTNQQLNEIIKSKIDQILPNLTSNVKSQLQQKSKIRQKVQEQQIIEEKQKKITHEGYTCDGCGVKPIVGIRYKCSICSDFDFCQQCQQKKEHHHPFLKIRNANQNTKIMFTILQNGQTTEIKPELLSNLPQLIHTFGPILKQKFGGFRQKHWKNMKKEWCNRWKCQQKQENIPKFKQQGFESQEQRNLTYATMIQEIFGIENFNEALDFVTQYSSLSKQELFDKIGQEQKH